MADTTFTWSRLSYQALALRTAACRCAGRPFSRPAIMPSCDSRIARPGNQILGDPLQHRKAQAINLNDALLVRGCGTNLIENALLVVLAG